MAQFNVFLFYSYAETVNKTLTTILTLPESNFIVDPTEVSKLQLQTVLAKECGFDFNQDEVKFILIGQSLDNTRNNAVRLVKNSSVKNSVVDDKEKLVESVLGFGNLSSKFGYDGVLRAIAKLN